MTAPRPNRCRQASTRYNFPITFGHRYRHREYDTKVETRWPPIRARGCAGSAFGEPNTVTIEVANGIATTAFPLVMENASMLAIAIPPFCERTASRDGSANFFLGARLDQYREKAQSLQANSRLYAVRS